MQAPGGAPVDYLGESLWINSLAIPVPYKIVAYTHLAREETEAELRAQAAVPNVVGIRMILNHHPEDASLTWPQVEHGDFFTSDKFRAGCVPLLTRSPCACPGDSGCPAASRSSKSWACPLTCTSTPTNCWAQPPSSPPFRTLS